MPACPAPCPTLSEEHVFLQLALQQAQQASVLGEVPVGAVVVNAQGQILAQAHNRTLTDGDPSAHAEMLALRAAAQRAGNHRLQGCTLYITLEPCAMCAGAILHARLQRVVYATSDPKTGAAGSVINLFANTQLNHQTQTTLFAPANDVDATLQTACARLLSDFFRQRRSAQVQLSQQPAQAALRDDALRPCASRFANITALQALQPFSHWALLHETPHNTPHDASSNNQRPWRLHYIDTAPNQPQCPTLLLLHGYASYHLLWADTIAPLHQAGWRVLAPDLLGHGQSDQPKKPHQHTLMWHATLLQQWLQQIHVTPDPRHAMLLHDSAIQLAPHLSNTFPHYLALVPPVSCSSATCNTASPTANSNWRTHCQRRTSFDLDAFWADSPDEPSQNAWSAPYPNPGHRAALIAPLWATPPEISRHSPTDTYTNTQTDSFRSISSIYIQNGADLRRWLRHNSNTLLAHLQDTQTCTKPAV